MQSSLSTTLATAADRDAILAPNRAAFGGDEEAELIGKLEAAGLVVLSLVARSDTGIDGHILYSRLDVALDGRNLRALALAPMAVLPGKQRRGIGSLLIRDSLKRLRNTDWETIFVVGHERYYPRFGFSPELARKFASPFDTDAFMALELKSGALSGTQGSVRYPAAFGL
jgi:putative acetyltransferase